MSKMSKSKRESILNYRNGRMLQRNLHIVMQEKELNEKILEAEYRAENIRSSWDSELIFFATKDDDYQIIDKRKEVPQWGEITTLDLKSNEFISIDRAKGKVQGTVGEWTGNWIDKKVRLAVR